MTLHSTLWRNLAIIGLVAAALTAAGEAGSQVTDDPLPDPPRGVPDRARLARLDGLAPEPRHVPAHAGALAGDALRLGGRDRGARRDGGPVGELVAARLARLLRRRSAAAAICSTAAGRSRAATTTEPERRLCESCVPRSGSGNRRDSRLGFEVHLRARARRPPAVRRPALTTELAHAPTRLHPARATACGRVRVPRARRECPGGSARQRSADQRDAGRACCGRRSRRSSRVVQAADWGEATTGPEDADPLPSCTGIAGFRSMWYSLDVPEAAVLRVTVVSTDPVRYQPVVNVLDPSREEVGCGLANDVRQGATANATAYVTPARRRQAADVSHPRRRGRRTTRPPAGCRR